jgi:L-alanine-DL-glutamate epimerase-like enolase superfamily enzyme
MNAEVERHVLSLETPFAISRGTTETADIVAVRIEHDGETGLGAAAPARRYGETPATVEAVLPELLAAIEGVAPENRQRVAARLRETARGNPAARAAVSIACHDLAGRRLGAPLFELWGLDPGAAPPTAFSLGIAAPETVADRAAAAVAAGFDTLKMKLGAGVDRDRATLAAVREAAPEATLLADANEGWGPAEALDVLGAADEAGVAFVEQPVPADHPAALRRVHRCSTVPVAVDESCRTAADVPAVADRADVVVVKVQKCGGPLAALEQVHAARAHGLDVMVGCMVESSASLSASVHLAPLADYADLDGSLLLAEDPYPGIPMDGAAFRLADAGPGTGARG